ncbi:MAG: hypothetical protein GY722_20775 [bacterium]|nr:hypothetical protein [bacterium]
MFSASPDPEMASDGVLAPALHGVQAANLGRAAVAAEDRHRVVEDGGDVDVVAVGTDRDAYGTVEALALAS